MHVYKELGTAVLACVTKADGMDYEDDWRLQGIGKEGELYILESDHDKGFYGHFFIPPVDYLTTSHIESVAIKTKQSIYYFNLKEDI